MHAIRILALTAFTAWLPIAAGAEAEELTFCYDPYPPYTLGEEGAPAGGLKVMLLNEVVGRIEGVTATVQLLPWQRCQNEVREGRIDGILPLFPNAERETYMAFSADTFEEESVFWYDREKHPDGIDWQGGFDTIAHLRLGMLRGSYIDHAMEEAFDGQNGIMRGDGIPALFLMLEYDRIDLVATDFAVGRYYAAQQNMHDRFDRIERHIAARASRFGLSRLSGADRHLPAFNAAIEALHREGVIERLQNETPLN